VRPGQHHQAHVGGHEEDGPPDVGPPHKIAQGRGQWEAGGRPLLRGQQIVQFRVDCGL
jgi:hypothetical protein